MIFWGSSLRLVQLNKSCTDTQVYRSWCDSKGHKSGFFLPKHTRVPFHTLQGRDLVLCLKTGILSNSAGSFWKSDASESAWGCWNNLIPPGGQEVSGWKHFFPVVKTQKTRELHIWIRCGLSFPPSKDGRLLGVILAPSTVSFGTRIFKV